MDGLRSTRVIGVSRHCTYNLRLLCVCDCFSGKTAPRSLWIVAVHVTGNQYKELIVARKSVCGEFMCSATIEPIEVKCPILYSYFNESCIFRQIFMSSSIRTDIRPWEAAVIQAEKCTDRETHRETDIMKLIGAFRSYSNALKNWERDSNHTRKTQRHIYALF
jgi:hypothetical protein